MKLSVLFALTMSWAAAGQQHFEVASIKPAAPSPMNQIRVQMSTDGGMLRYTNVSLRDCIRAAYRVKEYQVQGPDWIATTRFDIVAKFPAGATESQVPEMLQSLLADRFKLALHRESKPHAIYALVVDKGGAKLKPAETPTPAPAEGAARGGVPRGARMMMIGPDGAHLRAPAATLGSLAEMLSPYAERPVVDMTGIQGEYDFDLVFSPETLRNLPGGPMPPGGGGEANPAAAAQEPAAALSDAVGKYGLKLEPRKAPMDVLIVDQIEKTPVEN